MEFLSLAKQRCSVRKYKTDEIEKEKLDKILEAARIAPTAANAQSQRLLVISSQEAKEKLSKGVNYHGAPLAIIVCGDHSDVFVRPFDKKDMVSVDATIVAAVGVVDNKIHTHSSGNKLRGTVFPDKPDLFLSG